MKQQWFYIVLQYDKKIHAAITAVLMILCLVFLSLVIGLSYGQHRFHEVHHNEAEQVSRQQAHENAHILAQESALQQFLPTPQQREAALQHLVDIAHSVGLTRLDVQYSYPSHHEQAALAHMTIRISYWSPPLAAQQFLYEAEAAIPSLSLRSVTMSRTPDHLDQVQSHSTWRLLIGGEAHE